MAILNNITQDNSSYGVAFEGAYYRIATVTIQRLREEEPIKFSAVIDMVAYATESPDDNTRDIEFKRYNAPLEDLETQPGNTFLEKCYNWVMAQPDMAGSEEA